MHGKKRKMRSMLRTAALSVLGLMICLSVSACSRPAPLLVTPRLELPGRPLMLPVNWIHDEKNGLHILTDADARNLIINIGRKDTHIELLESMIKIIGGQP